MGRLNVVVLTLTLWLKGKLLTIELQITSFRNFFFLESTSYLFYKKFLGVVIKKRNIYWEGVWHLFIYILGWLNSSRINCMLSSASWPFLNPWSITWWASCDPLIEFPSNVWVVMSGCLRGASKGLLWEGRLLGATPSHEGTTLPHRNRPYSSLSLSPPFLSLLEHGSKWASPLVPWWWSGLRSPLSSL